MTDADSNASNSTLTTRRFARRAARRRAFPASSFAGLE